MQPDAAHEKAERKAAAHKTFSPEVNGDSPLGWASWHLRDRAIIDLLDF